jgi:membrane-associated phospholipid phosphatase
MTTQGRSAIVAASAIAGLGAAGVCVLADNAREREGISTLDPRVAADMVHLRAPDLTLLARVLTFVGSEVVVGVAAMLVLLALLLRRSWTRATVLAAGMAGSAALTVGVKLLVARSRPGAADRLGAADSSYSFPSGHTLNSAVFLALLCWLVWPLLSRVGRSVTIPAAAVLAIGIGWSRLYLGYHWFTDVLASVLVAASWLGIVWVLHRSVTVALLQRAPADALAVQPDRPRLRA